MALWSFRQTQRRKTPHVDRTQHYLTLLSGLVGCWQGVFSDARNGAYGGNRSNVSLKVEPTPDGWFFLNHYSYASNLGRTGEFTVLGVDPASGELGVTNFSGGVQDHVSCNVQEIDGSEKRRDWRMVLETVAWDDARPAQSRFTYHLSKNTLTIQKERRLINQGDYEVISTYRLTRV